MSEARTLLLGAIAGMTILFGLPVGRLRKPLPGLRQFLNAVAIGILVFLVWDVLSHAYEPIDTALSNLHDRQGGLWPVIGYGDLVLRPGSVSGWSASSTTNGSWPESTSAATPSARSAGRDGRRPRLANSARARSASPTCRRPVGSRC